MAPHTSISPLRALVNLISGSLDKIEEAYASQSEPLPSLNDATLHIPPVMVQSDVLQATAVLVSACSQLQATVQMPTTQIMHSFSGHYLSACFSLAVQAHVAEALRPTGDKGLHVRDIAKFSCVNSDKLARCLRMLATHYIFREVSPNVFANNKLSIFLDTGKDVMTLANEDPAEWFNDTNGYAAFVGIITGPSYKMMGCVPEVLLDPVTADSYAPRDAAMSRALGQGYQSFFDYLSRPEHNVMRSWFNNGMVGTGFLELPNFILHEGLEWEKLPSGSVVVDVGGGVGTQSLILAREHKHLKFVVQDLAATIHEAQEFWEFNDPEAVQEKRVTLQPHSFFEPNPVKSATVYLLREIVHNWPDKEALTILRNVSDAASQESRIILVSHVLQFASPPDSSEDKSGLSKSLKPAPAPLLPNYGPSGARTYIMDMIMLNQLNAVERTTAQFAALTGEAGLKIDRIVGQTCNGDMLHIVCSKI